MSRSAKESPVKDESVFRLNGKKFDLIFGSVMLIGSPFLVDSDFISKHLLFAGIFGLIVYVLEAWAFYFKTTTVRIRALQKMGGHVWQYSGKELPNIPAVMRIGRFMRACIRVYVFTHSVDALVEYTGYENGLWNRDSNYSFLVGIVIETWLATLVRIRNNSKKSDDYQKQIVKENKWRSRHADFLEQRYHGFLEIFSDIILLTLAMMFAHTYWNHSYDFFYRQIERAHNDLAPPGALLWTMVITLSITSILVVVPARLAYWLEEIYAAGDAISKRKVRWSMVFACAAFALPVFFYFFKVWYID
ncbi:MAG TPA: hypothetical protein VK826_18770 [Bacteroidia bacterium]|nr:hypothetical protein [Bacteroidia bacterium]